jgi:hypothetical protein
MFAQLANACDIWKPAVDKGERVSMCNGIQWTEVCIDDIGIGKSIGDVGGACWIKATDEALRICQQNLAQVLAPSYKELIKFATSFRPGGCAQ